ncbi:MAG: GntR family transcriptional regulator [Lachnospiraceae bacterium]|nr:GntR family transcriptional regulator [Lachnospiraceae bacterium]
MISIDYKSHKSIYEQIIDQIKYHVIKGYLKPGDVIPSVRKLALMIDVTPTTVAKAYQELERQQVIETIRGKGTFIASDLQIKPDKAALEKVRMNLVSALMELKLMGMNRQEVMDFVGQVYQSLQ